eukprot:gnl/TRDRNA2_/TRDRNA2_180609_c0_seq1.p1 gnl/TRDRNA2_/TRDRNA2_180609_c0~~gnl/TRDRNA2_/TRDRNA2_180609_c0_seq1.p1  ORF type:complete len:216 (+),score=63.09 gnl/TRDRNA2_/TRDRNA2_180609_c0_seq1:80-727(+)
MMHLALCFLAVSATPALAGNKMRRLGAPPGTNNSLSLVPGDIASMSPEKAARFGTDQLFNFLVAEESQEFPALKDFMPACLKHIRDIVAETDHAYTDHQLEAVLMDQCWLEKSFPNSHEDGFDRSKVCAKFASDLKKARYQELENGNMDGYKKFCEEYHEHKVGKKEKVEGKEKSDDKAREDKFIWLWGVIGILVIVAISFAVYILLKRKSAAAA